MIGALNRQNLVVNKDDFNVACLVLYNIDPMNDNVNTTNNTCQGSEGIGFILPLMDCSMLTPNITPIDPNYNATYNCSTCNGSNNSFSSFFTASANPF